MNWTLPNQRSGIGVGIGSSEGFGHLNRRGSGDSPLDSEKKTTLCIQVSPPAAPHA